VKRLSLVCVVAVVAAPAVVRADGTAWWNRQWRHRRTIEATPPATPTAGADVAVVAFLTMGAVQADGRDVRVVGKRQVRPSKVLMVGPGDRCLVAFEMLDGVTKYHVYFDNPKAEALTDRWEPRRGLLLEAWQWRGGKVDTLRQALQSITSAKPKQGADFVGQINHGWNPFGPSVNYVHTYTGWLQCPETGTYTFAVSAEHAAFLLVDGRPVVQWGGWHGPTWRANRRGQVLLKRGLHQVRFYHIEGRGRWNTAVVAWSLPSWNTTGQRNPRRLKFEVIPASAFAPVVRARLVDLEAENRRLVPDFTAENVGKAWLTGSHYLIRYRFTAVAKRAQMLGARVTWDFGDGTTGTEASAEHIYLNPGTVAVTLAIHKHNRASSVTNRLVIEQDWDRQAQRRIDPLRRYAKRLSRRNLSALRPDDLNTLIDVFAKLKQDDEVTRVGRVLLLAAEGVSDPVLSAKALLLARVFEKQKRDDEALKMLETVESRVQSAAFKARLAVRAGEMRLSRKRDLPGAARDFTRVLTRYGTARDDAVRWATIRLADVHRKQGDRTKAIALYEKAAAIKPIRRQFDQNLVRPGAPKSLRVSSYARTVEAFLFEKKTDDAERLLDSWEWDYPDETVKGHSALLRARLFSAKGDHRRAAEEAEDLAAFDPRNPYVPEAIFLAGQAHEHLRDATRAAAAYQRLIDDYPESPLVPQARIRLTALAGSRRSP